MMLFSEDHVLGVCIVSNEIEWTTTVYDSPLLVDAGLISI